MATDSELFTLIREQLVAELSAQGVSAEVLQSYQPTQEGAALEAALYLHKVSDHRYGFPGTEQVWNAETEVFDVASVQVYESLFQCMAWRPESATSTATASDLANLAAGLLQTPWVQQRLIAAGVNILRVTDVRNPYSVNDRDQFMAEPSFDFTLTHRRSIISTTPSASPVESAIYRV